MKSLKFQYDDAKKFLSLLDPDTTDFTFQCFHPDKTIHPTSPMHGTLKEWFEALCQYNKEGFGIYVTINETNGKGRKIKDIENIRAVWIEDDEGFKGKIPFKPSMVIVTSEGKKHKYLLVEKESAEKIGKDNFDMVQKVLVEHYGSDKNARDITRVLRIPGFYNTKPTLKEPFLVTFNGVAPNEKRYPWKKVVKTICKGKKVGGVKITKGGKIVEEAKKIWQRENNFDMADAIEKIVAAKNYYEPLLNASMSFANRHMDEKTSISILQGAMQAALTTNKKQDVAVWQQRFDGIPEMVKSAIKKVAEEEKAKNDKQFETILDSIKTFKEIKAEEQEPVKWCINDLIPEGLSVVGGRPKVGKSFWCLSAANAVAKGEDVFGNKTHQGTTLYISLEDSEKRLNRRLHDMKIGNTKNALAVHNTPKMKEGDTIDECPLCNFIKAVHKKYTDEGDESKSLRMVIIDTLIHILPEKKKSEDQYTHIYNALTKLQRISHDLAIAVVVIHHLNKSAGANTGNAFDGLLGSVAIQGTSDTMIIINRSPESDQGNFISTSRDFGDKIVDMEFNRAQMKWLKIDSENSKEGIISYNHHDLKIAKAINVAKIDGKKLTAKEIGIKCDLDKGTISRRIRVENSSFFVDDDGHVQIVPIKEVIKEQFDKKKKKSVDGRSKRYERKEEKEFTLKQLDEARKNRKPLKKKKEKEEEEEEVIVKRKRSTKAKK